MNPGTQSRISGALFDFMGYLTTREEPVISSCRHDPGKILDCFVAWAAERGLHTDDADVQSWHLGEALVEFYGFGRLPTRAPGSGTAGTAGTDLGRVDTTDLSRRRKWLDASPGGGIGSVTRFHPDDPPKHQRMETKGKSGISVLQIGTSGSDHEFEVVWPNGTREVYLINPYLGKKFLAQLGHGAAGRVANQLKKHGRRIS